ncbi:MAG: hypothetical protein AMJ93_15905 [Anaerolineae bacterium SM23_84]|jgi:class 3 adenylate cyclase|nr:MAG: hypothetical protein AMJ93_15905 [Anaerolineae bacterium SM23_84]
MPVFFFTDIEGSTRLWEKHTADMGSVIARHDAILQGQIEACGGRLTKHTGDGVTAVFETGEPVTCALETQKQFARETWPAIGELRIRVALHAGEAELLAGDYFGPTVNCTARIMAAAWGGQILLTPRVTRISSLPTQAEIRNLGTHLLKDVSAPQEIYQLTHPDLPWQQFPPLRTLSSNAIHRTVKEQGQQLVSLPPSAMAIGLASATLLPTLLGDLSPSSPALAGNLGVLSDLGAYALRDWMAGFVQRLRARQQAGEEVTDLQIRQQLEMELLELWQAGGDTGAVLRADASQLLRAVQGVETALQAAAADVQETLAQGLKNLGSSFLQFRWMLDGLDETLAEVRDRQAVQLAMQQEQLQLERETLGMAKLILQRLQGGEILDPHSLAWLSASREGREIGPREFDVLVDSVVHHAADVQPWHGAVGPPEEAVRALERGLRRYPKPDDRLRLIKGLEGLEVDAATDALLRVALTEDVPQVRAKAAVAAAQRGRVVETMAGLVDSLDGPNHAAALAAFAEVADVVGIPEDLGAYPRTRVLLALAWRRWQANREAIMRQAIRAGFGGAVMSLFGCLVPLFVYLAIPEVYYDFVEETLPLSAWIFSGAMMFLLIGSVHGAASGFALGVADALCHDIAYRSSRLILGIGSGMVLSMLLILLSLWQVASPEVGPVVFIPVYILYGLAFGAASTVVTPRLGTRRSIRPQLRRAAVAMLVTTVITVPYVFLLYPNMVAETLPHRLSFAVVFPLIMALVFVGRTKEVSSRRSPPTKDRGF